MMHNNEGAQRDASCLLNVSIKPTSYYSKHSHSDTPHNENLPNVCTDLKSSSFGTTDRPPPHKGPILSGVRVFLFLYDFAAVVNDNKDYNDERYDDNIRTDTRESFQQHFHLLPTSPPIRHFATRTTDTTSRYTRNASLVVFVSLIIRARLLNMPSCRRL